MSVTTELKRIEEKEDQILANEKEILTEDKYILKVVRSLARVRESFVKKVSKKQILFGLAVTVGMVAVWRGTWEILDNITILESGIISVVFGLLILWLLKKASDLTSH